MRNFNEKAASYTGVHMERIMDEDSGHCCLVAIGRLQVTSTPNVSDLSGSNSNTGGYWYSINCWKDKDFLLYMYTKMFKCSQSLYRDTPWTVDLRLSIHVSVTFSAIRRPNC